jgi:uncharacterized protein
MWSGGQGIEPADESGQEAMKVLITGSSGFIGQSLMRALKDTGHEPLAMVRRRFAGGPGEILWDPASRHIDLKAMEGIDAVVHLAGENIAGGRWTEERKRKIRESRVAGTTLLATAISNLAQPPKVFLCASAIGYYGNRAEEIVTEDSLAGQGFLAEVCREWEDAARTANPKGIRIILLRIGIVLSREGGALAKMILPFKLGLGGKTGTGRQYMSWITLSDLTRAILFALECKTLSGPVNLVAPMPVTNEEFALTLSEVLHRPCLFPLPAWAARAALGEMADALLLSGARVVPARLQAAGFIFRHEELRPALNAILL